MGSGPRLLNPNALTDSVDDRNVAVAQADGTLLAVWSAEDQNGVSTLASRWDSRLDAWSLPHLLGPGGQAPSVATDGLGTWLAAWDSQNLQPELYGTDGDIFFARSVDNGLNWTTPAAIGAALSDIYDDFSPSIAVHDNTWTAVWSGQRGTAVYAATSTNAGASWSHTSTVSGAPSEGIYFYSVRLVASATGVMMVSWISQNHQNNPTTYAIQTTRSLDYGRSWQAPQTLYFAFIGLADTPTHATDHRGRWLAAWTSRGFKDDFDIFVAESPDDGESWLTPRLLNSDGGGDVVMDMAPDLAWSGSHWRAVWQAIPFGQSPEFSELRTAKSYDLGQTWTPAEYLFPDGLAVGAENIGARVLWNPGDEFMVFWQARRVFSPQLGEDFELLFVRGLD